MPGTFIGGESLVVPAGAAVMVPEDEVQHGVVRFYLEARCCCCEGFPLLPSFEEGRGEVGMSHSKAGVFRENVAPQGDAVLEHLGVRGAQPGEDQEDDSGECRGTFREPPGSEQHRADRRQVEVPLGHQDRERHEIEHRDQGDEGPSQREVGQPHLDSEEDEYEEDRCG